MKKTIGLSLLLALAAGLLSSCQTPASGPSAGKPPATGAQSKNPPTSPSSPASAAATAPSSSAGVATVASTPTTNPVGGEDVFLLLLLFGLPLAAIVGDTIRENEESKPGGGQTRPDTRAAATNDTMEFIKKTAGVMDTLETFNVWHAENRRALYHDAGDWARHYSIVRLTVGTFLVTTCVAILVLKPERMETDANLGNAVALLWLIGLFVFYTFTFLTYKERNRQLEHRKLMPVDNDDGPDKKRPSGQIAQDAAAYALLVLNCLFAGLLITHEPPLEMWAALPWVIALAGSAIVLFIALADCGIFKTVTPRRISGLILTVCVLIGANYWVMYDWMR